MPDFFELTGALPYEPLVQARTPLPDSQIAELGDPYAAGDRIEYFSRSHAIDVTRTQIDPTWRAFEIARFQVGDRRSGVVEQIGVSIDDVWAWEDLGGQLNYQKVLNYGPQNGNRPTLDHLDHPNPAIGQLQWKFSIQAQNLGSNNNQPLLIFGSAAQQGSGQDEPWADLWSASDLAWGQHHKRVMPSASLMRLIIWLRGPVNAYSVRVGGRLAGFTQSAGTLPTALRNVITRH